MPSFESLYVPPPEVAEALRPLLQGLFSALQKGSVDLTETKTAIVAVLEFLCSQEGHTDANCRAVDSFLMRDETWNAEKLPEAYVDVLSDMCGALHDAVSAPKIAANFDSMPEQLLTRARKL